MWNYSYVFSVYGFHRIIFVINIGTCSQRIESHVLLALETNKKLSVSKKGAKKQLTLMAKYKGGHFCKQENNHMFDKYYEHCGSDLMRKKNYRTRNIFKVSFKK